jgi:hypothetical protein
MLLLDINEARKSLPKDIQECKQIGDLSICLKYYFMQNISMRDFILSNLNLYGQLFDWTCSEYLYLLKQLFI